jgi:CBS domain-containing protein
MNHPELNSMFKTLYPFSLLTEYELDKIIKQSSKELFSKNQYLFHEDEKVEDLDIYFLVSGLAKNILHRPSGDQVSLRYYYPGDLMGLMIMVTSGEMTFSVQILEESTVIRFNKADFFEVMTKNKDFSKVMFESIGERMKTLYDEIKYKSYKDESTSNYLFRTRIKSIMEKAHFVKPDESIKTAAEKMLGVGVKGLIVSQDEQTLDGIITQEDLLRYITNGSPSHSKVRDFQVSNSTYLQEDSFAYEAVSFLKVHKLNFIPITNNKNVVKGTITKGSFVELQNSSIVELTHSIINSKTFEELSTLSPEGNTLFQGHIGNLLEQDYFAYEISETITNHNDHIYKQIIKLTEEEMRKEGYGLPPVTYCFIVMGSQGRKEQAFHTDQDNGVIISDYSHLANHSLITAYFDIFTSKINTRLAACGYIECTGGIMAKEKKWRKTLSEWHAEILNWSKEMDAEEIQSFTMLYDFRPIYGDFTLAEELRTVIADKVKKSLNLQQLLIRDSLRFRIPVNPLGKIHFLTKQKLFDLKKSGLMQITNAVRIHSMKYGIKEVNTIKRLNELKKLQVFHPRDIENAKTALHHFISLRLVQNLEELKKGIETSNTVKIAELSKEDKDKLKEALQIANRMQQAQKISLNRNRVI